MPARPRFSARKPGAPSVGRRRKTTSSSAVVAKPPEGLTSNDELAELIGSLTGKEVVVGPGPALVPGPQCPVVCSTYVDEHGAIGALLVADIAASAAISAALTLMPAGSVTDAVRAGELDEALLENWGEIANVSSQIVRLPTFPKFKLSGSVQSSTGLTPPVEALFATAQYRAGWTVQVPGYANGRLSVVLHREE